MNDITAVAAKSASVAIPFAADGLTEAIRHHVRLAIVQIANEELTAFLGAGAYARIEGRRGYRNGSKNRSLATSLGKTEFRMPRAVVFDRERRVEWQSSLVPRYARRAREVDAALLGLYFGGVNTRKVKRAIRPLLRNSPLSKSAISRLVVRLKEYFENWSRRSLAEEDIRYLYLDAIYVRVRCAGRSGSLPVMVAVGVRGNGEKALLSLRVMGGESAAAWEGFIGELGARKLPRPKLAIIDGNPGLASALEKQWPGLPRQRCVVHKLRNLLAHAPKRAYDDIRADFHAIVYAESPNGAKAAYEAFLRKWRRLSEGVARSLEEAGEDLLTYTRFPEAQCVVLHLILDRC